MVRAAGWGPSQRRRSIGGRACSSVRAFPDSRTTACCAALGGSSTTSTFRASFTCTWSAPTSRTRACWGSDLDAAAATPGVRLVITGEQHRRRHRRSRSGSTSASSSTRISSPCSPRTGSATSASRSRSSSPTTPTRPRTPPAWSTSSTRSSPVVLDPIEAIQPRRALALGRAAANEAVELRKTLRRRRGRVRGRGARRLGASFEIGRHTGVPLETARARRRLGSGPRRAHRLGRGARHPLSPSRPLDAARASRSNRIHMREHRRGRQLRRPRRLLPRGLPRPVARAPPRPPRQVDRGPRRAPRRHQPRPRAGAPRGGGVRRRRAGCSACATRSGTTRAPTSGRRASSSRRSRSG